ncbi:MAG: response regulator transcription factor [Gammaproteobacteria bacterium]|nr:response regulator transcription factor [Gammaproteobacteria bacterium]
MVLIDDHTLFRTGINELLIRRNFNVVGMTGNPAEALALVKQTTPDLVLLDLRMQELSGLEVLKQIREEIPDQHVVILTTSIEETDLLEALKLGATGYLLKDLEPDTFVNLLHQAHAGETVVAPDLTGLLAKAAISSDKDKKPPSQTNSYHLTAREMDILHYIAKGWSNKDIARHLGIVDGTVKLHVRAVLKKLKVKSRVQAAILAVSEGLVADSDRS